MRTLEFNVGEADVGLRLDQYLVGQVGGMSRARIQGLIKSGNITLNGVVAKANARMRVGDGLRVEEPELVVTETVAEDLPLEILHEDEDVIVLNKRAGWVVHPAAGNWVGTVVNALLHHCPNLAGIGGEQRPGIVHRLDKETSGCLVVAKNDLAHRSLSEQFAGREVTKIYLALAAGRFREAKGVIERAIGRHPVNRKKMAVVEEGRGRGSRTDYRVLGELGVGTLVECTLHTGRTHQIRVHLQHLGHPILGDEVYGKRGGFERQMLHAWQLGFRHPRSGDRRHFCSPIPEDFVDAGVTADFL